ncbi:MAG: HAMP domain-containing histidine kinase [Planctomycetes bacterium]|nr:HAMP domain-containing histidine kinase [Planctomycetota bacterium]
MRLVGKLVLAIMAAVLVVLGVHAFQAIGRRLGHFEGERQEEARLLGRVLAAVVRDAWKSGGVEAALSAIDDANKVENAMAVEDEDRGRNTIALRLVVLDAESEEAGRPYADVAELRSLAEDQPVSVQGMAGEHGESLLTYFLVDVEPHGHIAIEIRQPVSELIDYRRGLILRWLLTTALMFFAAGVAAYALGRFMVGRPIVGLMEGMRRVGEGDLSTTVSVGDRRDEIGDMAESFRTMVAALRDSQERIREENEKRIAAVEQLQQAERLAMVGQLASGLAHELGTPLNVVAGRAKMIAEGEVDANEVGEFAGIIGEQARRMTSIVRQLLDFARRRSLRKAACELGVLAEHVVTILRPIASERGVELRRADPDDGVEAEVDAEGLEQVLTNLITNAIEASPAGGVVDVRAGRERATPPGDPAGPEEEYIFLRVEDRGEGISPENLGRIFAPFFSTRGSGKGTGLGLAISQEIVREHGGWIAVRSEVGKGSYFTVYLLRGGEACRAGS